MALAPRLPISSTPNSFPSPTSFRERWTCAYVLTTSPALFFYRGRELDDGKGLLQGGGKEMRIITLRAATNAESTAVKQLLRQAFRLGGTAAS